MDESYAAYFQALADADVAAAVAALDNASTSGASRTRLIRDVIARGQRRAGELWMAGTWSVADEHAATAVAEQSLSAVAPPRGPSPARRHVVLACAEGEWHTFPARLAADLARTSTLDVTLVGGSVPTAHLQRCLQDLRPDALAVSTTMPSNLIGAARSISAARGEGIPVVVGGAAWGRGQHRAHRLGADAHVEDPADLAGVLEAGMLQATSAAPPSIPVEALLLDSPSPEVLLVALERQVAAHPWMRSMSTRQRADTLDDLRWLARYTGASLACEDPTILRDLLDWLTALLEPRGVPVSAIYDSCLYLAEAVEPEAPGGAALLRDEAGLAHQRREVDVRAEA